MPIRAPSCMGWRSMHCCRLPWAIAQFALCSCLMTFEMQIMCISLSTFVRSSSKCPMTSLCIITRIMRVLPRGCVIYTLVCQLTSQLCHKAHCAPNLSNTLTQFLRKLLHLRIQPFIEHGYVRAVYQRMMRQHGYGHNQLVRAIRPVSSP